MCSRTWRLLALHAIHFVAPLVVFFIAPHFLEKMAAAFFVYIAIFSFLHDTMHGALFLSKGMSSWCLTLSAALIGVSGHAMRRSHLFHHQNTFHPDDFEGNGSFLPFHQAMLRAPSAWPKIVKLGWQRGKNERSVQAFEWVFTFVLFALAFSHLHLRAYVVVAVMMQIFAPVWAGKMSHAPPSWVMPMVRFLAKFQVNAAVQLLFHDEHHQTPKRSCFELGHNR